MRSVAFLVGSLTLLAIIASCGGHEKAQTAGAGRIPRGGFATWAELQQYIADRHERIRDAATEHSEESIWPAISLKRGIPPEELEALIRAYNVSAIGQIRFRAGEVQGTQPLSGHTVAEEEASLRDQGIIGDDDHMFVYYFEGKLTVTDALRLAEAEPVALVYADDQIDRLEGRAPDPESPEPITDDYQRLAPGIADR